MYGQANYGAAFYGLETPATVTTPAVFGIARPLVPYAPPPTSADLPQDLALAQGDLLLAPDGDLAIVTGNARYVQDLTKLALTPQGASPFDPEYGDGLVALIGKPIPTLQQAQAAAANLAEQVAALQQDRQANGSTVALSERGSVTVVNVATDRAGNVSAALLVTFPQQAMLPVTLPLPG